MSGRRPLPALGLIVVLAALTTYVWWQVLHRPDSAVPTAAVACPANASGSAALPAPSSVAIRVLNATDTAGLAATTQHELQVRGFQVGSVGNAASYTGVALIDYVPASKDAARLVAFYFPGAQLRQQEGTDRTVTVTLGTAFKGLPSDAVLASEFASAHVSPPAPAATHPATAPATSGPAPATSGSAPPASAARSGC